MYANHQDIKVLTTKLPVESQFIEFSNIYLCNVYANMPNASGNY